VQPDDILISQGQVLVTNVLLVISNHKMQEPPVYHVMRVFMRQHHQVRPVKNVFLANILISMQLYVPLVLEVQHNQPMVVVGAIHAYLERLMPMKDRLRASLVKEEPLQMCQD